jgi:hypothetical protein
MSKAEEITDGSISGMTWKVKQTFSRFYDWRKTQGGELDL